MKRSEINATIKQFEALLDQYRFRIPPYLSFTPEECAKLEQMLTIVSTELMPELDILKKGEE